MTLPAQRLQLERGWALWPDVWLRSSGFPAHLLEAFGAERVTDCVDKVAALEGALALERARLVEECRERQVPRDVAKKALEGRPVDEGAIPADLAPAFAALREHHSRLAEARSAVTAAQDDERRRLAGHIRTAAGEPLFREALLWQNRSALNNGVAALLRSPQESDTSKVRQHERLVGNYLQRYCAKNDTIGFFGPVGWASFTSRGEDIQLQVADSTFVRREVYFEHWAVDALAATLAEDREILPFLCPRNVPTVRSEPRFVADLPAKANGASGRVVNLSETGLLFVGHVSPQVGSTIALELDLPSGAQRIEGVVRWVEPDGGGTSRTGVLLPPRSEPSIDPLRAYIRGARRVRHASGADLLLPEAVAATIEACTGETPAREIARRLLLDDVGFRDEEEVFDCLEQLVERGLITWTLELPIWDPHPEKRLESALLRIEDPRVRDRALEAARELEQARTAVAAAAGDPPALDLAIERLEQTFTRLTGVAPVRRAGQTYAGRTVFYEDCVRGVKCEIGPGLVERVSPGLSLVLESARWYTHALASRYLVRFHAAYREITGGNGGSVEYLKLWRAVEPIGAEQLAITNLVSEVVSELHDRWQRVLDYDPSARVCDYRANEIRPRVLEAFSAPSPGWTNARYHSPDLLISAESIEDVRAGRYTPVLGEVHASTNTLFAQVALAQHPNPERLYAATREDLPGTGMIHVVPKGAVSRCQNVPWKEHDLHIEMSSARSPRPRTMVLSPNELCFEEVGGQLLVRTIDGVHQLDAIEVSAIIMSSNAGNAFGLVSKGLPHTPRLVIDGLVVQREQWTFSPEDVPWASIKARFDRLIAAHTWCARHGIPRYSFARTPEERKPFFVDFKSPLFVEILAGQIQKASSVTISEMMPDLDHLWLHDAKGDRYVCELRMVAVDPAVKHPDQPLANRC